MGRVVSTTRLGMHEPRARRVREPHEVDVAPVRKCTGRGRDDRV